MSQILVIDDNLMMRKNIKSIVENLGHEVIGELETGEEIIDKYQEYQPDIVTLDIVMPGIDGLSALKELMFEFPKAKVIMVSVLGENSKIIKAIKLGAEYYLQKPIDAEEMCKAIKEALDSEDGNKTAENTCASIEDLEENIQASLKKELSKFIKENPEESKDQKLEEKLQEIEVNNSDELEPIEVSLECSRFKIKVNQDLNERLLNLLDDTVKDFLVVEPLKITFDLKDVAFLSAEIKKEFEKIVRMIKVIGGEVKIIS